MLDSAIPRRRTCRPPRAVSYFAALLLLIISQGPLKALDETDPPLPGTTRRPVRVEDSIGMTKLGHPRYNQGGSSRGLVAQFSPNGRRFVAVVRRGDLEKNTNEYSMLLWNTNEVFRSTTPELLLKMSSSSNRPAIEDVTWLRDNETITFLGEHPGESHQLYTYNIRRHSLERITNHPTNLLSYGMNQTGRRIAYVAEAPIQRLFDQRAKREGLVVSTQDIDEIITGRRGGMGIEGQLFTSISRGTSRRIETSDRVHHSRSIPVVSPDGKYVVILLYVRQIPEAWKGYDDQDVQNSVTQARGPEDFIWLARYVLVDLDTGEDRVLLDSPAAGAHSEIAWSPQSDSVVITNVYLPLRSSDSKEPKKQTSNRLIVEVKVPTGEIVSVSDEDLKLLRWDGDTNQLVFENGRDSKPEQEAIVFTKSGQRWEKRAKAAPENASVLPQIVLEEDMNTPPKIVAVFPRTHEKSLLLDLNPQFESLAFGKIEEIEWKDGGGRSIKGGLYYPAHYLAGKKYPLLIQTHGWSSDRFNIDGPFPTAYAAQVLAGRDIMVLQEGQAAGRSQLQTTDEAPQQLEIVESAIAALDERGLIDRGRVGLLGFSRTCYHVKYALTHSKQHFAAVSVTDGIDAGYFQYLDRSNVSFDFTRLGESVNGAAPFGAGLLSWVRNAPGFNLDKVQTPVLIVAPNTYAVLDEWEWFAGLLRLGKPVEMVVMEDGDHLLQRPWERRISLQGTVDWFAFWLAGQEDPDPAKSEQYARWRNLRKLQEGTNLDSVQ